MASLGTAVFRGRELCPHWIQCFCEVQELWHHWVQWYFGCRNCHFIRYCGILGTVTVASVGVLGPGTVASLHIVAFWEQEPWPHCVQWHLVVDIVASLGTVQWHLWSGTETSLGTTVVFWGQELWPYWVQ